MKETENFILQDPIKVSLKIDGKNDFVDIETLYLSAPTYKQKDKTLPLKQAYISACLSLGSNIKESDEDKRRRQEEKEEKEEKEGEEGNGEDLETIRMVIYGSGVKAINLQMFFDNFGRLLESVAFKDEEMTQSIKRVELEKLSESDLDELVARYIQLFFITSWMKLIT